MKRSSIRVRRPHLPANLGGDLQRAFLKFHRENPAVWIRFAQFALELIQRGRTRYSADAVMHRVRWETALGDQNADFKINNNHIRFYSRTFQRTYPEHAEFFLTREYGVAA